MLSLRLDLEFLAKSTGIHTYGAHPSYPPPLHYQQALAFLQSRITFTFVEATQRALAFPWV